MRVFRVFLLLLLVLGLVSYLAVVIAPAVSYYRSAQRTAYGDIEALFPSLAKLKEVWSNEGELSALQGMLERKNQEMQNALVDLKQVKEKQVLISRLETISANLSFIGQVLKGERGKAAEATRELETKVNDLKARIGPADSIDKIAAVAFHETGIVILGAVWPLTLLAIFFYLMWSDAAPDRLKGLLKNVRSFEVSPTGAKLLLSDTEEAKAKTEGAFEVYRAGAKLQYDLWVERKGIRQKLEKVVEGVLGYVTTANKAPFPSYRCTRHVPDIVFADTLYQLLDYQPTGGGRGRIFSVRFGIIGKVWRLGKGETRGDVPKASTGAVDEAQLVQQWGMTKTEAQRAARDRPSFLCVPLEDAKDGTVGIFYMDSQQANAFKVDGKSYETLEEEAVTLCNDKGLTEALAKMKEELSGRAPLIRIYER